MLAYRLYEWKRSVGDEVSAGDIAARLEALAVAGGVGLTPLGIALDRARAAVAAVDDAFEAKGATGDLREYNQAFKEARKADPSIRYAAFIASKKAAMLEALAQGPPREVATGSGWCR